MNEAYANYRIYANDAYISKLTLLTYTLYTKIGILSILTIHKKYVTMSHDV